MAEKSPPQHIVLVAAMIEKDGKYLIAQRSHEEIQSPGKWSYVGGKVDELTEEKEQNHILEKTLKKEIKEEVAIEVHEKMKYIYSGSFVRADGYSVIKIYFLCHWKSGEAKPLEDSIDIAWISPAERFSYDLAGGVEEAFVAVEKYLKTKF